MYSMPIGVGTLGQFSSVNALLRFAIPDTGVTLTKKAWKFLSRGVR